MRTVLILLIKLYRYALSPWLGQHCRFYPTCSHYAESAIERHGIVGGGWLALRRLSRCHPWHPGGVDPVPDTVWRRVETHPSQRKPGGSHG
ncbi:MAG TPA: membrane protein insertion efficiency factor YidD [Gammaproteobacteria bacterium]|nr:membrane protein insertion efficiency factor YidD [Gammaproteobacteria bacterium]